MERLQNDSSKIYLSLRVCLLKSNKKHMPKVVNKNRDIREMLKKCK